MDQAIVADQLTKFYDDRKVVDSLCLSIPRGCVYGFLGLNGAGKTTTIKMLLGLVRPDRGHARLLGDDCADLQPATLERVSYLAENHPLHRWMTVRQAADFARSAYSRWDGELVDQLLDYYELRPQSKIGRLSNGQRAQVALALALAPDPELLILDDPTLGLDTLVRQSFLESLVQFVATPGRTVLFSSHILGEVEQVADRIGILLGGVLRVDCTTRRLRESLRKLVVTFPDEPPAPPDWPTLLRARQVRHTLHLVLLDPTRAQREWGFTVGASAVDEVELGLEEAFVAYAGGRRLPAPRFARRAPDERRA